MGIPLIAVGHAEEAGHLVCEQVDDGHDGEKEHQRVQQQGREAFLLADPAFCQANNGKQADQEQGKHQPQVEENGVRERVRDPAKVDALHHGEGQHTQKAEQYGGEQPFQLWVHVKSPTLAGEDQVCWLCRLS